MPRRYIYMVSDGHDAYGRGLLEGALALAKIKGEDWWFRWGSPQKHWPEKPDGLLVGIRSPEMAEWSRQQQIPLVNFSSSLPPFPDIPAVIPDNQKIGQLVGNYFKRQLIHRFAFVGTPRHHYSNQRAAGFEDSVGGSPVQVGYGHGSQGDHELIAFLETLTPGTGIFAANDYFARQVISSLRKMGKKIPGEFSVVGVDCDPEIAASIGISLTSVDSNAYQIGYAAAQYLDDLMEGRPLSDSIQLIAPNGIVAGKSSGFPESSDPTIRKALERIREMACEQLSVENLAQYCNLNRRSLERLFRKELGVAPAAEIRHVQMQRAGELLRNTNLPISQVGQSCGYEDNFYFSAAFKKATGFSPRDFRAQFNR